MRLALLDKFSLSPTLHATFHPSTHSLVDLQSSHRVVDGGRDQSGVEGLVDGKGGREHLLSELVLQIDVI